MRYSTLFSVALFSVALPFFSSAEHHGPSARRHNALANRKRGEVLQSRGESGARATFYDVGLGACGKFNAASDFIVALNSAQFGGGFPGPNCFKMITITHNGKSTQAQIMDECPGCPPGGLDMSRGLFTFFEPESVGVFSMDWHYNDGDDGGAPPPKSTSHKPKPSSTWTPPASTSSTWSDPSPWTTSKTKSSSTWSSSSSSTTSKSSTSSSSSTSHSSSSTSASSTPTPSATPPPVYGTPAAPQNLQGLNALVGALGNFVVQLMT